jgi:hypothetical protein
MDARTAADAAHAAPEQYRRAPCDPAGDGAGTPDPAKLLAAACPVEGEPGLAVLAPADMVLHSATHLFFERRARQGYARPARSALAAGRIRRPPGFWDSLVPRARELQLERPLFYALRYSRRLLATAVPQAVLDDAGHHAPNPAMLWLMDRLFGRALLPPHASCNDIFTGPARFMLYVRGNWLRMPPLMLARHLFHKAFLSPRSESTA